LQLKPGEPQIVYLRVQSQGNLTVPLALWRPAGLQRADHRAYSIVALYFGALLALAAYNLLLFITIRELRYLYYVAFGVSLAVAQASLNGIANEFLWPGYPEWGNAALVVGFGATGIFVSLFTRSFLDTGRSLPWLDKLILAWMAWFGACVFATLISYRLAAVMVALAGVSFSLLALTAGILCYRRHVPGAGYFLLAWTFPLLGAVVTGSRNFNLLPAMTLTNYAMQIGSGLEMVLLSFALADRINTARREKEQAQAEALQAKQHIVETLKRNEQQLEERVAHRTRELADAYARLQKTEQALRNLAYQDNLTGLANRILGEDRLSRAIAQARRDKSFVAVLVVDLDRFKTINDTHGHTVGDEALKAAARRIQSCVRTSDTVARIGGDEFLIVLEGMQAPGGAERVADAIIEALAAPIAVDELTVTLGASIGVAIYPTHAEDLKALIKHADETMYKMKAVTRSRQRS
jgi:diguanylate cyclase (GGDEF)-like protein